MDKLKDLVLHSHYACRKLVPYGTDRPAPSPCLFDFLIILIEAFDGLANIRGECDERPGISSAILEDQFFSLPDHCSKRVGQI